MPETGSPAARVASAPVTPDPAGRRRAYRVRRAWRWAGTAAFLLLVTVLFTVYLRLSQTYPENSDEANILLMASDLAHGNLFLSGWDVSDVPFISTELPEIAVLVRLFGLHLNTAHIAAALTYTVVLATAMLLGRGRTTRHPLARMAVVLAIMLAPQPGVGVFVLVFSVGHIGTAAPVMLTWLFLDRYWPPAEADSEVDAAAGSAAAVGAGPARAASALRGRWHVPVIVAVLLAWALLADPLVLVIAVGPLLVTAAARTAPDAAAVIRGQGGPGQARRALAARGLELALLAAAVAGYLAARCGQRLLHAAGGYTQQPVPFQLDPVGTWYGHARIAAHGLLEMFGAFFLPGNAVNYLSPGNYVAAPPLNGLTEALAVTRLACVAAAIGAGCVIARRFFRRDADVVSQLLLLGLVANLAAYIPSSLAGHTALNAREFAPVLPFAAVLAARTLGDWLGDRAAGSRLLAGALVALLGWYGFGLAREAAVAPAPDPFVRLEAFLESRGLHYGIGGYWDASAITVDTGGAVTIRAVTAGCLQPYDWESKPAWYDPARHTATFLLTSGEAGYFSRWLASPAAVSQLGARDQPGAARSPGGGYQVRSYPGNILAQLPLLAHC